MTTTNELLEEMEAEMLSGENDIFVVDNNLRTVSIPESMSVLGVEHDDDVHRLYFKIPKMYGDTDLSDFDVRINYMNAAGDGDVYAVTDKEVSGDNITFSWLVGRHAFAQRGDVIFIVCLKQTDDEGNVVKEFNTTVTTLPPVLEGLETSELVIQDNPDIIEQILARLDDLEENGGGSGTPGKDGREIEIQNNGIAIQWRYVGDEEWTDLVQLSEITGAPGQKGDTGPQGPVGPAGKDGEQGPEGDTGATPNIQIGTVQTLEPGQQATASMTGTPENPLLNLGIPKGEKGDPGEGSDAEPYELPIMSDTQLGGGKAVSKTDEDVPVAVDPETGQLFVPTYPENVGGDTINVDAELKEYMSVAKPAIASAIINKGGSVEPDDSLNDYATRISAIPNDVYPAETLPVQTNLSASGLQDSVGIKLNWSDVNASGYLILRKENAMPATSAVYYYRIFPRNSKNQYQSLEDGAVAMVDYKDRAGQTLLGDLPLGTKIKFGQWDEQDFFWEVVDTLDKNSGFVTVAADQNLGNRQFDAPEPNSPISNRKTQGNNRWAYSAVRQLLNSEADTDAWWTAQYEYDAEPSYAAQIPGFMKDFTTYEKGIVVTKTNKCILPNDDGGGTETVQDKFWFPSYYAMGLGVIQPLEDDHIYEKFTDNASRSHQSNYWLRSINGAESPSGVRFVNSSGTAGNYAANGSNAARPFCQLPTSAYMTWSGSDEAYVFADDSQRNPSAS